MNKRLRRLFLFLSNGPNHGVSAPRIFTAYEKKLLAALIVLALTLIWALARNNAGEGILGVALIGGLAFYLAYNKYYRTFRPAMDRWGIRELASPEHPRTELRVADRDLLVSEDEVNFIARQNGVRIVSHPASENPAVTIYESERRFEHRLLAGKLSCRN